MAGRKRQGGEKTEKDREWREGWKKITKSNGFEEHDSKRFLILAVGKKRKEGEKREKKKEEKEEWGAST